MLKHRLISGMIIGPAFIAATLFLPFWAAPLVLGLLCALASWEFYALLEAAHIPSFRWVGTLGSIALLLATWFSMRCSDGGSCAGEVLVLFAVTVGVFIRQFPQKNNPNPLETIAGTLLGVLYVGFLLNFITRLLLAWGFSEGRLLVLYMILVVKITDVGAFFVGCSYGRHKLIPRISPAKTWEGVGGGLLAGVLASTAFWAILGGRIGVLKMSLPDALILGVLLSIFGIAGDLTESLFKRAAGVKDSGTMVRGMGGVLDVLDSVLFASPVLYLYAVYFLSSSVP